MKKKLLSSILIVLLFLKFVECEKAPSSKTFLVVGDQTATFQGKYTLAVYSMGYDKPEPLQMKIFGKLSGRSYGYENVKNVTLKKDSLEKVEFDLKDQLPGNYFLRVTGQNFEQTAKLNFNTKKYSVFIQSDKAIYKPGDKVQFRILILNADTKPYTAQTVEVFIKDANDNRIKQYQNVSFSKGVYKQELQLSEEPVLGNWGIHVKVDGNSQEYVDNFEVAEYVLPKFEVSIVTKSSISYNEDIVVSFNAKYTYGMEVEGSAIVTAEITRNYWEWFSVSKVERTLDNSTKTTTFSLASDFNIQTTYYTRTITITVTFTEALTGKQISATSTVAVYPLSYKVSVEGSDDVIKPGIPFSVKTYVKDLQDTPITDNEVPINIQLTYTLDTLENSSPPYYGGWWYYWWYPSYQQITETVTKFPNNGVAELPISVTPNVTSVSVSASYKGVYGYLSWTVKPTANNRYIKVMPPSSQTSTVVSMEIISNTKITSVNYIIIGRNNIVSSRQLKSLPTKSFKFYIFPTLEMGTSPTIIAFYLAKDGEIISDQLTLNFNSDLRNFVNIELSQNETKPSSQLNISVKSKPQSYVGLLGVDQSVLILKSGNDIDRNMVNNELSAYSYTDTYNNDWSEPIDYNYFTDFSTSNTIILTNARTEYQRPVPSYYYYDYNYQPSYAESSEMSSEFMAPTMAPSSEMSSEMMASMEAPSSQPGSSNINILTRKTFPETWLFDDIDNIGGTTNLTRTVPDTITSWIITGFSVDSQYGLGLTKEPTKLKVFMPFFISLNLPYSVKRGETIAIEANIFNYLNEDYPATITMFNDNQEFQFAENTPKSGEQQLSKNITSKANSGTSVKFLIKALKIGQIMLKIEARTSIAGDRIENPLLVEAEGITKYFNEAFLIDLRTQHSYNKQISIVVPQDYVPDSLRIESSIIGDVLGPAIDNLDGLIRQPYGCGEQNMLNFVPNIIAIDYLTVVNKLTPQIRATAVGYMEDGYQRELTYKRYDGSYSAFGNSDSYGSTWLTAFVVRSFRQASKYITVDQNVINDALNFLQNVQSSDGSFPEYGTVHHKDMQGGSSGGAALTAYVLLTFLENQNYTSSYKSVIDKAIDNVILNTNEVDDVYVLSIAAYTLYLAGRKSAADTLLYKLDKKASNSVGSRHWEKVSIINNYYSYYSTSLSIETSAYALLAYLEANREADALMIMKWLVTQRNAFGGFSSTQDTVIGLLALSKIAGKILSNGINMKIDFKYQNDIKSFNIDQSNSLILQQLEISSAVRNIEVAANGTGVAIAQISYSYNVNQLKSTTQFVLTATVDEVVDFGFRMTICAGLNDPQSFTTTFPSSSEPQSSDISSNTGSSETISSTSPNMQQSNMAVMEVSAPSGYVFDLENHDIIISTVWTIKRVDFQKDNTLLNIYFDYLQVEQQCIRVISSKAFDVTDQKPASVVVYDYYENDLRTEVFYTLQ